MTETVTPVIFMKRDEFSGMCPILPQNLAVKVLNSCSEGGGGGERGGAPRKKKKLIESISIPCAKDLFQTISRLAMQTE